MEESTKKLPGQYTAVPTQEDGSPEQEKPESRPGNHRFLGLLYAVLHGLFLVIIQSIIKYLHRYSTSELSLYQSVIEVITVLPFLLLDGTDFIFFRFWFLLMIRSVFVSSRIWFRSFSSKALPIAEAGALLFTNPAFNAIASRIFLKYPFNNSHYICIVSNAIGMILVSRLWSLGFDDVDRALGLASALLAVLLYALGDVVLKKLTNANLPSKLIVFYVSCLRGVYMLFATEFENGFQVPRMPECDYSHTFIYETVLIVVMGSFTLMAQILISEAIRLENPITASAVSNGIMLPSFFISQIVVFGEIPIWMTIFGTFLIFFGSMIVNFSKIIMKLENDSKIKEMFNVLNE